MAKHTGVIEVRIRWRCHCSNGRRFTYKRRAWDYICKAGGTLGIMLQLISTDTEVEMCINKARACLCACLHRSGTRWWASPTSTWLTACCRSKSPRTSAPRATLPMTWGLKSRPSASKPVRASLSRSGTSVWLRLDVQEREPRNILKYALRISLNFTSF